MDTEYYNDCFIYAMKIASEIAEKVTDPRNRKYLLDSIERGAHNCKLNICYAQDFYTDLNALYTELLGGEWDTSEDCTVV